MRSRSVPVHVTLLLAILCTVSCAPQLTPHQEVAWDAFKACQSEGPSTKLERVHANGAWGVVGREGEVFKVHNCMLAYREKATLEGRTPAIPASVKLHSAPAPPGGLVVAEPPVWAKGDTWRFSSNSTAGRQSRYTWRVDRDELVDGVAHYVIKSSTREYFYRKSDLALSRETMQGELRIRNTPPRLYYVWPLAVGASWEQTFRYERPEAKRSYDTSYKGSVDGEETLTVPAGTFRTLKIVYRSPSTNVVNWAQWYAPDARMWVRMHEPARAEGERTRELLSFTLAGKTAETEPK